MVLSMMMIMATKCLQCCNKQREGDGAYLVGCHMSMLVRDPVHYSDTTPLMRCMPEHPAAAGWVGATAVGMGMQCNMPAWSWVGGRGHTGCR